MSALPPLTDLCVPEPGSTTLRRVVSAALGQRVRQFPSLLRRYGVGPVRADVAEFTRGVLPLLRRDPGALAAILRRPEVSVWLRCLVSGTPGVEPSDAVARLLSSITFELARRGALPESVVLRRLPARLVSGAGRLAVDVPSDCTGVRFAAGEVVALRPGGEQVLSLAPDDRAYRAIDGTDVRLALVDDNPLAEAEAHPDKAGNALDLGGRPAAEWTGALAAALATIDRYLPAFRQEVELLLHQVVPVGWDAQQHLSASVRESVGTIYLSLHPKPLTMVEAVIHEVSHNKLSALFELDPVLHNAFGETYSSPVRPDPRPLHGVLLAVHAFVPVAALYTAMLDAGQGDGGVERRLDEVTRGNRDAARVLAEHARPTQCGAAILEEIERRTSGASAGEG